ncbi:MAG: ABC transporter permease [Chloroflexi bacterium]|nr:ABC transporter permease [Chloroflexota bacterium]
MTGLAAVGESSRGRWRSTAALFRRGQVPLARRSLLYDRVRLAISIGGLAFAVVLVLLLRGIMDGTVARSTSYIDRSGADLFVASAGVTNMALASSALPADTAARLADVPGVAAGSSIIRLNMIAAANGKTRPSVLIGYAGEGALGGPWKLASGRRVAAAGEVVVDRYLAAELGVRPGDPIELLGQRFTVVGLSDETAAIASKYVFIRLDAAQELLRMDNLITFVLIRLEAGVEPSAAAASLAGANPALAVLTRKQLATNDRDLLGRLFVGPVNVMSTIGFLVGLAIVGLTMYTTTAERLRDFGVLKAIGAPNAALFKTVGGQAVFLAVAGYVAGFLATLAVAPIVTRVVPDIAVSVRLLPATRAFAAVLGMSVAGSMVPLVRILRVDPLMVFRR